MTDHKYSTVGQHTFSDKFISDICLISMDNKVRFVGLQDGKIYIADNFIKVPGLYK